MKDSKEKWIEEALGSMSGSSRATPGPELFARIESQLDTPKTKLVPMYQWKMIAAAAVLLLSLNVFALYQVSKDGTSGASELVTGDTSNLQLVSDYKIYE